MVIYIFTVSVVYPHSVNNVYFTPAEFTLYLIISILFTTR